MSRPENKCTVEAAKNKKRRLESKLQELLLEFTLETGMKVDSVSFYHNDYMNGDRRYNGLTLDVIL